MRETSIGEVTGYSHSSNNSNIRNNSNAVYSTGAILSMNNNNANHNPSINISSIEGEDTDNIGSASEFIKGVIYFKMFRISDLI